MCINRLFYCIYLYIVCKLIQPILHSITCFLLSWHWAETVAHYLIIIIIFSNSLIVFPHLTQCLDFSIYETLKSSLPILVIFTMRLPVARYPRLLICPPVQVLDVGKRETCVSLAYVPSSRPETVCELVVNRGDPSKFLLMLCKQGSRHFSNYLYIYKSNTVMGKTNKHSLVE